MRILELENRCTGNPYRGFESHPLRQSLRITASYPDLGLDRCVSSPGEPGDLQTSSKRFLENGTKQE